MGPTLLWELRGRTGKSITCALRKVTGNRWLLTVDVGEHQIIAERFSDDAAAFDKAEYYLSNYKGTRDVEVLYRDPRV
jgi:hypothetical protein